MSVHPPRTLLITQLVKGVDTLVLYLPPTSNYETNPLFATPEQFVTAIKTVVGQGLKRVCLVVSLTDSALYDGLVMMTMHDEMNVLMREGKFGTTATMAMLQILKTNGFGLYPGSGSRPSLPAVYGLADDRVGANETNVAILEKDEMHRIHILRTGRELIEVARATTMSAIALREREGNRNCSLLVAEGFPEWCGERFDDELVPVARLLGESFPTLESVSVMTESQESVRQSFQAIGWRYESGQPEKETS